MGFKAIQAKQAEFSKTYGVAEEIGDELGKLNEVVRKLLDARKKVVDETAKMQNRLSRIDTRGDQVLESIRLAMLKAIVDPSEPLPELASQLRAHLTSERGKVDDLMQEWIEKNKANCPDTITKGMLFKFYGPGPYQGSTFEVDDITERNTVDTQSRKKITISTYQMVAVHGKAKGSKTMASPDDFKKGKNWKFVKV